MVFVWSYLTRGDAAYTLVQVAVNDLIMLVAFAPIVVLLLGISNIQVPWDTVLLSVLLYIVIPLAAGYWVRNRVIKRRGLAWFNEVFLKRVASITPVGLIVTLVLLFAFQGDVIIANPLRICTDCNPADSPNSISVCYCLRLGQSMACAPRNRSACRYDCGQ